MTLDQKFQKKQYDDIWQEHCGFLDFSIFEYMAIQKRLLIEQIELYSNCELGRRIMKGKKPSTVDEYRQVVPLTRYEDYADLLLPKIESALPSRAILWIETTWEGGKNPIKVAPYTESMLKCHKSSFITCMILATSNKKGQFTLRGRENFLYGMAPLPYLTGIVPYVISDEFSINFLPSTKEAEKMSFGQRNKTGLKMGLQKGIDLFFGLSSVIVKISESFSSGGNSGGINVFKNSPKMNYRLLKAWAKRKQEQCEIKPRDIWTLKGLICAGTDTSMLKKKIEYYWGVKPLEIFGGTEPTCIATETWSKNGLVFFPDVCFYEFIPKSEIEKNIDDPSYIPNTYLMDELVAGNEYELVISNLKGGAFARYRMGDIFKCLSLSNEEDGIQLPQFAYVDRDPRIIDIAGFTRISEGTITEALELSKLNITDWFAVKEFDEYKRAFLHLYVEVGADGLQGAITKDIIKEHLSIYFRYVDTDYNDLKSLLGIDPLMVSIIPAGTIGQYCSANGRNLRKMNPSPFDVIEILKAARSGSGKEVF
ncbi:MAG: Auxin-responsive protein [Desulfotomaculum sp. 46_296]|nr:MAG: Auxin-responsive protein [Desulfotomaculum sp. 46_296]HAG08903.1 auxin-responsive protein [Desulfotomaculum sp.]HAU30983.1 auxin-responsive protein [Desulfotomaculum sp.]